MELLFARLPASVRKHATCKLARFLTTSTLTSVTHEAAVLCNAAVWVDPTAAAEFLLEPLVAAVEAEAPLVRSNASSAAGHLSKVKLCTI